MHNGGNILKQKSQTLGTYKKGLKYDNRININHLESSPIIMLMTFQSLLHHHHCDLQKAFFYHNNGNNRKATFTVLTAQMSN